MATIYKLRSLVQILTENKKKKIKHSYVHTLLIGK